MVDTETATRKRFLALVEGIEGIVWEGDPSTFGFTYVSPQAETVLGYPIEDWYEDGFWEAPPPPRRPRRGGRVLPGRRGPGRDHELEYRMVVGQRQGRPPPRRRRRSTSTPAARSYTVHGVMLDVTERKRIEQRVRQYADIVETIDIGLVVVRLRDADDELSLELVAANPAACAAIDRPLDQSPGRRLHEALPNLVGTDLLRPAGRRGPARPVLRDRRDRGAPRPADRADPRLPGLPAAATSSSAVSLSDVTTATLASQALRRQALHDGLTGLPNRTLLQDRLGQSLRESARSGEPVALLVMDLDQFKEVNDALGHHVGDRLLIELAERLQQVRPRRRRRSPGSAATSSPCC